MPHDIFISYSSKDREKAEQLTEKLSGAGLSVWIDRQGIDVATTWSREIAIALESCKTFVILLSPSSIASANVAKELSVATELGKMIVPIELEPVELKHEFLYHLSGLQRVGIGETDSIIRAISKPPTRAASVSSLPPKKQAPRPRTKYFIALAVAAALALVYFFAFRRSATAEHASIVVLPFRDESAAKDNEHIAAGFSDELLKALFQIDGITVVSKATASEYQKASMNPFEVASDLGIQYIVTGSVLRRGDSLTVRVELDDGKTKKAIRKLGYSGTMKDIFDMQDKLADDIATLLNWQPMDPESFGKITGGTKNTEAYQLYLKADAVPTLEPKKAIELLDRALALDSNFALAWAEKGWRLAGEALADGSIREVYPEAVRSCERAIALAPKMRGGYTALAWAHVQAHSHGLETPPTDSIIHLADIGIRLEPNNADAYLSYNVIVRWSDPSDPKLQAKCIEAVEKALRLDPTSAEAVKEMTFDFMQFHTPERMRPYADKALRNIEREIRLDPDNLILKIYYTYVMNLCGKRPQAFRLLDSLVNVHAELSPVMNCCANLYNTPDLYPKLMDALERSRKTASPGEFEATMQWIKGSSLKPLIVGGFSDRVAKLLEGYPDAAKIYFEAGEYAIAANKLEAQAKANEKDQSAVDMLTGSYAWLGKIPERNKWAARAMTFFNEKQLVPAKDYAVFSYLALLSAYTGDRDRAMKYLSALESVRITSNWPYAQMAEAYALLGEKARAMAALSHAVELGFKDITLLEQHPDFAPLRNMPEFISLVKDLKSRIKH